MFIYRSTIGRFRSRHRHGPRGALFLLGAIAACGLVTSCDRSRDAGSPTANREGAFSAGPPPSAPPRTSEEIFAGCLLCHSTKEMQRGPILDGLPAWYVESQLKKFSDGVRGRNPENISEALMGIGSAQVHDPEERRRVAGHIAALPPQKHLLVVRGDQERGRVLYQACVPCHGEHGEGRPEVRGSPLTMLEDWYQLDQLRKFKSGLRGSDPRDAEGIIMRAAVTASSDQDLRDVTRYIAEELARPGRVAPTAAEPKQNP